MNPECNCSSNHSDLMGNDSKVCWDYEMAEVVLLLWSLDVFVSSIRVSELSRLFEVFWGYSKFEVLENLMMNFKFLMNVKCFNFLHKFLNF